MDNAVSLMNLPTELLVEILSYLPTRDIIEARHVSKRFKDIIIEMPLLWKKFNKPCLLPIVNNMHKACGKYARQIFFPVYMTPADILEMVRYCPEVTHLSLPRRTQLSLDDIEKILHMMTNLQQLDVFTSSIKGKEGQSCHEREVKQFLKGAVAEIKCLTLRIDQSINCRYYYGIDESMFCDPCSILSILENLFNEQHALPSIINLLIEEDFLGKCSSILESWSLSSYTQVPFKIYLYDIARVPIDIYPPVPLRRFQFGSAATPPLIKLRDHGIQGLECDIFYLSDYDHYGEVKHSVIPKYDDLNTVKNEQLHCISNLSSVSNVDFSGVRSIYSEHLEQLANACPMLYRLNLMDCASCLQSLQGLCTIVYKCKNLQGLSLVGIPVSKVESYLYLWELLSSVKKLTHLAICLCMLTQSSNHDNTDKQKLISMLRSCGNLKALEIQQQYHCTECNSNCNVEDLLFSHFLSLAYLKLSQAQYSGAFKYAVTNCHQLKYLYCGTNLRSEVRLILPLSSSCHLQQLCMEGLQYVNLSAPSIQVLSAHGELEKVVLLVKSITTSAVTTLIGNSPNLILLYVVTKEPLCDENDASVDQKDFIDTLSKTFPCSKFLTDGDFVLRKAQYTWPLPNSAKFWWSKILADLPD